MIRLQSLEWPDDLSVIECANSLHIAAIETIADAVMRNTVDYVSHSTNGFYHHLTFDFLGFRYHLDAEEFGTDTGIRCVPFRLEKVAKVDVDDGGEPVVVESYPLTRAVMRQKYEGNWGSF